MFQLAKVRGRELKTNPFKRAEMKVVGMNDPAKTVSITTALKSKRLKDDIDDELKNGEGPINLDLRGMKIQPEDMQALDELNMKAVRKGSSVQVSVDTAEQSEQIRKAGIRKNGLTIVTEEQLYRGALEDHTPPAEGGKVA